MLFKKKIVFTEGMNETLCSFDEIPWFSCCGVPYDKPSYYPYLQEKDPKRAEKLLLHTKNYSGTVCLTNLFKEGICRADTFILQTAGWKFYQNEFMPCVEASWRTYEKRALKANGLDLNSVEKRFLRDYGFPDSIDLQLCRMVQYLLVEQYFLERFPQFPLFFSRIIDIYKDGHIVLGWSGRFASHETNLENENGVPILPTDGSLIIWYLLLTGNAGIDGSGLSALQSCKLDLLALDHTRLEDAGLLRAASIPKLSHIWIDHTAVTYDGLLAVAGNNYIHPVAHVQFTKEQMEHFSQLQREKAKKPVQLDEQAASECRNVLSAFFAEMTEWEQYMEQVGFEDAEAVPRLLAIWEKYVSEKPRLGYRPLALSYSAQGTYNGEEFLDAEQITKNKLYIYTREKNTSFDRRFLMKRVGEGWMIDAVQERLDGWQRTGL